MTCPYCGSQNIQTHVVKKDKQARNALVLIIALLLIFAFAFLYAKLTNQIIWGVLLVILIVSIPILIILRIILLIIPSGKKTIAVCCNCGEEFKI